MYKLIAVGGKLRGQEFDLSDGDNGLGRGSSNAIHVPLSGVSKNHLMITVHQDAVYIEDLKSSSGSLVNGKLIKKTTAKSGDKIAIPDCIFQLVFFKEDSALDGDEGEDGKVEEIGVIPPMPASPMGKIIHLFKYKGMPHIHTLNKEYEWRSMVAVFLAIYIVLSVALIIFPVLRTSKSILIYETSLRGVHYADEIARLNARILERGDLDQINTNFMKNENDVASYELFDLEGRIVSPQSKMNKYITDSFSISAKEWAGKKNRSPVLRKMLGASEIGIAQTIMANNSQLGYQVPVGVIAIRFAPKSLSIETGKSLESFAEAIITSTLVAIILFGLIYFLTIRPIEETRNQIELVLRGKLKELEVPFLMTEMKPLQTSVNSVLQMWKESQADGSEEFDDIEDDSSYVRTLEGFMEAVTGAVMILNSEKLIQKLNVESEDLIGIRESASAGANLMDIVRDQGLAATIIDLCDKSANSQGGCEKGEYDVQGKEYVISATSLLGKDNFAKAYFITFMKDE